MKVFKFLQYYFVSLVGALYLYSFGFLRGKNRTLLYAIAAHFSSLGTNPFKAKPILPEKKISKTVGDLLTITVCEPDEVDGNVTLTELVVLDGLVRRHAPARVLEIGTFDGRTTLNLASNTSPNAEIHTLDLPQSQVGALPVEDGELRYIKKPQPGMRIAGHRFEKQIVQHLGDSALFDFSRFGKSLNLVFVDGAHSQEYVLNDSLKAIEGLDQRSGVIVWHDYGSWNGVTNVLNTLYQTDPRFSGLFRVSGTSLAVLVVEPSNTVTAGSP